jgi:hypothetical protein
VLAAVVIAVALRLIHGPGALGYDALWALRWGDEIAHGHAPSFGAEAAPTPHPLANLVAALLAPAGADAATTVLLALSWLSLGALAVGLFRLGSALFSAPVGALAAAAVVTRAVLVLETAQAYVDVTFLALAVIAADVEVHRPRRGVAVPVLLVFAGLLRPEGWALAAVYLVYRRWDAAWLAPLLALGPVLWALMDLWATGDALHSLHGTRALAEELGRPRSADSALTEVPTALREIVQEPLLWVALVGAAAGLSWRVRASALPAALLGLGVAGFMVLALAGLPLLGRYLLLPACMLLVFAGLAVFGWLGAREHRRAWVVGGVAAAAVVLAGVPSDLDAFSEARDFGALRAGVQDELRAAVRAAEQEPCGTVVTPDRRSQAVAAAQRAGGDGPGRLVFAYQEPGAAATYAFGLFDEPAPPRGGRLVHAGRYWRAVAIDC